MGFVEEAKSKGSVGGRDSWRFGSCRSCKSAHARDGQSQVYPGGGYFILGEVGFWLVAVVGFQLFVVGVVLSEGFPDGLGGVVACIGVS